MSIQKINPRTLVLALFILITAVIRVVIADAGPLSSFTPIGAMALFGGACFSGNMKPFGIPMLALLVSDLVLSFTLYASYRSGILYAGWYWVYLAFFLMSVTGRVLIKEAGTKNILFGILIATLIHWLVADLDSFIWKNDFQTAMQIYGERLIAAIPFELKLLIATSFYSVLLFGSFQLLQEKYPVLKIGEQKRISSSLVR